MERPNYKIPEYLYVGQEVYIPWTKGQALKCRVVVAAGDAGRVTNEKYGVVNQLVDRYDMLVPVANQQ